MGVSLLLFAVLAQAPSAPAAPGTVEAVEIRLPVGAPEGVLERVSELVTVRKGQALSARAVRQSIEGLYASGRFSDIVVTTRDDGGKVTVVFALTPQKHLGSIYVEGAKAFGTPELLALTHLAAGKDEYWPERVVLAAETLREFYRRRGYQSATVTPDVQEGSSEVDVGFVIDEGDPTHIAALSVAGDPAPGLLDPLSMIGLAPGDVLDEEQLEAGVERFRAKLRQEHYYRAKVDAPEVLPGGRVVFPVTAGPRYRIAFTGNRSLADVALRGILGYSGQEGLDGTLEARLAQRLEKAYRFRGFHDAKVTVTETVAPSHQDALLTFEVDEGAPVRISTLTFEGNKAVSDDELEEVLAAVIEAAAPAPTFEEHALSDPQGLEGRLAPVFAASLPRPPWVTVFDEAAWADAIKAMTALYRERGFLSASVRLAGVVLERAHASARFVVREGPRASFRSVALLGAPSGFRSDAVEAVQAGSVFSVQALDGVKNAVLRELGRKGYLFATVESDFALDTSGRNADSTIRVKPGPQVRTRRVLPVGNARTRDETILSLATMVEGQPLDSETLFTTQNALMQTGAYRTVDVEMLSPDVAEPLKTVLVTVREAPRLSPEFGFGYFFAEGPRVVSDVTAPNLFGRAISLSGHLSLNWFSASPLALSGLVDTSDLTGFDPLGFRGNISAQGRGLLPENIGTRFDLVGERVFRPTFRFTRVATVPSLDWSRFFDVPRIDWARLKVTLQLQYQVEFSRVTRTGASSVEQSLPLSLLDQQRLRFLYGDFMLQTVKFAPTLDLRDNAFTPRKGVLLQASGELTGALYTRDELNNPVPVGFAKVQALASGYVPVWRNTVLALSARGGRIFPLVSGSVTPPVNRFFMGGSTSMRGFNEDQLLAQDLRAQYRDELAACTALAVKAGCTENAQTILAGRQVPSPGGELFALFKAELRFPAFTAFDVGVFMEAGNLWLSMPTSLLPLRVVAGTGLRYVTPIGPIAVDVAFNLAPDTLINEPAYVVHFNIGVF